MCQMVPPGFTSPGRGLIRQNSCRGLVEEVGRRELHPGQPGRGERAVQRRQEQKTARRGASLHSLEQVNQLLRESKISESSSRFLNQWIIIWNGFDGNIYITSARKLPKFKRPKILIHKQNEKQLNWYPTLLSDEFGDKIGGRHLHLYWAEFSTGLGQPNRIFRKVEIEFQIELKNNHTNTIQNQTEKYFSLAN